MAVRDARLTASKPTTWKVRLALASPVLLALGLAATMILPSMVRPTPPPFVPSLTETVPAPYAIPASEPYTIPIPEFLKDFWNGTLDVIGRLGLFAAFYGCLGYGVLIGGRVVRALIRWEDQEETTAGPRPFVPSVKPVRPIEPALGP